MSEVHESAPGAVPRPPWEFELLGVRCPVCGLGGDIPSSIERTICPRCEAVFVVRTSLAERPGSAASPLHTPPAPPAAPIAPTAPTAVAPTPPTAVAPTPPTPHGTPAPPAPAPSPTPLPPPSPPPTPAPAVASGRPGWWRTAAIGAALFGLGVLVGWTVRRDGDEGAAARRAGHAAPATTSPGRAISTTTDVGRSEQDDPADGDESATAPSGDGSPTTTDRPTAKRPSSKRPSTQRPSTKRPASKPDRSAGSRAGDERTATSTPRPRPGTDRSPATTRHAAGGAASTTAAPPTSAPGAVPARPALPRPSGQACEGLGCHMTGDSGVAGIPIPSDALEIMGGGGATGWTTTIATIEELTAWYRNHLDARGWTLEPSVSVLDPAEGPARDLGHATSAVYCPDAGNDAGVVAVNVGWPDADPGGGTVVLAIVAGIDDAACD